jgi:hypothetical protein
MLNVEQGMFNFEFFHFQNSKFDIGYSKFNSYMFLRHDKSDTECHVIYAL